MKAIIEIEGQEYYTMQEACAVLGIKPTSLYAYVSRGRLRSYRQGMRRHRHGSSVSSTKRISSAPPASDARAPPSADTLAR